MGSFISPSESHPRSSRSLSGTLLPLFIVGPPLLKPNSRKKGALIIKRLLRNQGLTLPWAFGGDEAFEAEKQRAAGLKAQSSLVSWGSLLGEG